MILRFTAVHYLGRELPLTWDFRPYGPGRSLSHASHAMLWLDANNSVWEPGGAG